jgi:aerobic-type carbon monoxide dehydrogenase small subunit (CoxS/CutS family)
MPISHTVNGQPVEREVEPRLLLSDYLRHRLELTGTRVGCEPGVCGACTVLLDGEPVRSCLMFTIQTDGHAIETVESLAQCAGGKLHALQEAFHTCHALQCGFCTSGFLMTLLGHYEALDELDEAQVRELISGNVCRCTGYEPIVDAVLQVGERERDRA